MPRLQTIFPQQKRTTMKRNSSLSAGADNKGKPRQRIPRVSDDNRPGFRWTERADAMLLATYEYRAMEPQMYERLFFPLGPVVNGKRKTHSNCQRYLRELSS